MLDTKLFDYAEERREALACHNIALWYKLHKEQELKDYYFNKMIADDYQQCRKAFD